MITTMDALTDAEQALWHAWKHATETVRARIVADIGTTTGLSDPDFGILTRVAEDGAGTLRQNELAASMGWHRSRLSHQLTRMEQRGLLTRAPADGGVEVTITTAGLTAVAQARPLHAAAVRQHLTNLIPQQFAEQFQQVLATLGD